jgi:hypothetical protein
MNLSVSREKYQTLKPIDVSSFCFPQFKNLPDEPKFLKFFFTIVW